MLLSADNIVLATKENRNQVVLNKGKSTESTRKFDSVTDCLHCMSIITNQLNLIRVNMADKFKHYGANDLKEAYTVIANYQKKAV